ncbi:MAG TPA: hypothetical protein PK954_20560 [Anaerolineales bacterium]|nr:hypothetical protein [Anaerolineales bacterium]HRF46769.1 hypothetical protein [Anaerolineales bacterium]
MNPFAETQPIAPEERLWGADLLPVACPGCQRGFLIPAGALGRTCPICGRDGLEPRQALMRSEPPEFVLPFRRQSADLGGILARFVEGVWLRPVDFTAEALVRRATPVYWPMWLVDGRVLGSWEAEFGFDYQVESARDSLTHGQWRSEKVLETRIRWEPRAGLMDRTYANVAAPALTEQALWLKRLGPYPEAEAQAFESGMPGAALVCIPDVLPEEAWPLARAERDARATADCQTAAGAQHVRQIALHATYPGANWTQLLLPAYVTYYTDDAGGVQPVWINGVTGAVGGRRLASPRRGAWLAGVLGAIAVVLALIGLVALIVGALFPPVALLGGLALLAALGVGVGALVPAIWPRHWNQRESSG